MEKGPRETVTIDLKFIFLIKGFLNQVVFRNWNFQLVALALWLSKMLTIFMSFELLSLASPLYLSHKSLNSS